MLNSPQGIFVNSHFDLYVADCGNNRVQLFRSGEVNGTTVIVNGSNGLITLNCPMGIVLDGDGYLFILDGLHHRVIGSGPWGFRCVVGCSGSSGPGSNQLLNPQTMSFDRDGNLFVMDQGNDRIQKFLFENNSSSCGKSSRVSRIELFFVSIRFFDCIFDDCLVFKSFGLVGEDLTERRTRRECF